VTVRTGRADQLADSADQLVAELVLTTVTVEPEADSCLYVPAGRLAIDAGSKGDGPESLILPQPPPQHLFDLNH
jgi:hypothetical protein